MILLDLIATVVGGLLPSRTARSAAAKRNSALRVRGQADLAVRLLTGELAGLGPEFRSGSWRVRPGEISLGTTRVAVENVGTSPRLVTFREAFHVHQDSRVWAVEGAGATLEIAIQESDIRWVINTLRGQDDEEPLLVGVATIGQLPGYRVEIWRADVEGWDILYINPDPFNPDIVDVYNSYAEDWGTALSYGEMHGVRWHGGSEWLDEGGP